MNWNSNPARWRTFTCALCGAVATSKARRCRACWIRSRGEAKRPERERFAEMMPIGDLAVCWMWPKRTPKCPYGSFMRDDGRKVGSHRMAWIYFHGEIPDGLQVCHKCDVMGCINPTHLFLGTNADNSRDMIAKQRHYSVVTPERVRRGVNINTARLTEQDVLVIRAVFALSDKRRGTRTALARQYGISKSSIGKMLDGTSWTHLL